MGAVQAAGGADDGAGAFGAGAEAGAFDGVEMSIPRPWSAGGCESQNGNQHRGLRFGDFGQDTEENPKRNPSSYHGAGQPGWLPAPVTMKLVDWMLTSS